MSYLSDIDVNVITGRNEVVAKVMFLLVSDILLTGGGLPQCMLGYPPRPGRPPWDQGDPPGPGRPPGSRLRHTVNEQPVCILLECILVNSFCLNIKYKINVMVIILQVFSRQGYNFIQDKMIKLYPFSTKNMVETK